MIDFSQMKNMNATTPNQFENLNAESAVDRMAVVTTEEVFTPADVDTDAASD